MAKRHNNAGSGKAPPGPVSIFRRKIRKPVTLTMTPEHHIKVNRAMKRLGCSRADVLALLVDKYADALARTDVDAATRG